ncbi:S-adenosyl-L-methionine-dependent methyltransferase [Agrocybe pediades]|nr:S-adenosyl-L-methionine-dependent methyltransferase [Agrocybe pediades]
MPEFHPTAQKGFGAGTNELYDRARPTYQPVALDHIRNSLKEKKDLNIVEIGADTGIFTRAVLKDPQWNSLIKELKAFEPSEGMRDVFTKTVAYDGRVSIAEGYFDSVHVEDGWADLVVIAQAFHWCPDYNAAAKEFARILKPTGCVAFIWNLEDRDRADWVGKIRDTIEVYEKGAPQFRHMRWKETFEKPAYQQNFEPPQQEIWDYHITATEESVVERASSKSYIAMLPDDKKKEVQDEVRRIINQDTSKVWMDKSQGTFEYPYKTYVVICHKKS